MILSSSNEKTKLSIQTVDAHLGHLGPHKCSVIEKGLRDRKINTIKHRPTTKDSNHRKPAAYRAKEI